MIDYWMQRYTECIKENIKTTVLKLLKRTAKCYLMSFKLLGTPDKNPEWHLNYGSSR